MEAKESYEIRCEMAEVHDKALKRIETAYNKQKYIEVCWLCYACFESRVNRTLEKICYGCPKPDRTDNRKIGITRKLECYVKLIKSGYEPLKDENVDLIQTVKGWCKERNDLVHGMISLEYYNDADKKFESLAKRGKKLVRKMYELSSHVREYYYDASIIPAFDETITSKCDLKSKCIKR